MSELECPVSRAATLFPDRTALEFEGTIWTWRAVNEAVGAHQRWLGAQGISAGDRISVLSWNRPEIVFLWFAAARRGASLAPLNVRLTSTELAPLIERARPTLVLADPEDRLAKAQPFPVLAPNEDAGRLNEAAELAALFTSGTTGTPSLVPLTVGNFVASHRANAENLGASERQVWLGTLPLFHVGGLAMVFRWAMMAGRLVLERQFDVERVRALLDRGELTHASLVPTALARVIDGRTTPFPSSLQAILVGGGPMGAKLLERSRALRLPVLQTYGLTEACSQVTTDRPAEADGTTAGPPLPGISVRIVDERGAPVAPGIAGLIEVKGATVSASGSWLATNDLGLLDDRGRLTVHARRTDLILSGGENVYPAEIEAVLAESPLVEDVAVAPVADVEWGQVPVALVVWKGAPEVKALEQFARSRLAGFKVPRHFVMCTRVPRNAAGKLLRHELAALFPADLHSC